MPNYCNYEMKIKGSKKSIQRVLDCLKADYNYGVDKPEHKHFFRVFGVYCDDEMQDNGDGTFTQYVYGDCAWSVHSCMCSGGATYYSDCKKQFGKNFMGTTLAEQSKNCEIEVFSEEEGMEFSEHYFFKNGKMILDDCVDCEQAGYTRTGKITKRINWDTYDGELVCLNPHRENQTESFKYEYIF